MGCCYGSVIGYLGGSFKLDFSAHYNATGSQIVTASMDRTAKIWDASTRELLQTLKGKQVGFGQLNLILQEAKL